MIGTTIGHYQIRRLLGHGGMGEVYEAEDTRLGRRVALKFLPRHLAAAAERRERFEREARSVAALNHPSIVTIFSIEEHEGEPFLTMELVDGTTVSDRIAARKTSLDWLLTMAIPLADAVAAAHQRGILHRDLKPGNVMVGADGRVKVLDFGLAKLREEVATAGAGLATTDETLTGEGKIIGTVAYMSPEQAEGKAVDERSDIFSLGVMLYEIATGERPFKGETSISVISSILRDEPSAVTNLRPELPHDLARIIKRALAKDPEHRYQSAKDLRNDLEDLRDSLAEQKKGLSDRSSRRSVLPWLAAAGAVAIGTTLYVRSRGGPPQATAGSFDQARISRLTGDGSAGTGVAISRDGRYVVYVGGTPRERSLTLRQTAAAAVVQLVPPTAFIYQGTAFSPDGNFVYYSGYPTNENVGTLYRVPILGGAPQKLIDDIDSNVTFSPDGSHVAFLRNEPDVRTSHLVIAGADGGQPRLLAERKYPNQFFATLGAKPAWSPDGRLIAAAVLEGPGRVAVAFVDAATGAITIPHATRWTLLSALEWTPDGSGLLASARDLQSGPLNQIWHLPYANGAARQITNGLDSYSGVSLSGDGRSLVSIAGVQEATLWVDVRKPGEPEHLDQVSTGPADRDGGAGVAWTRDNQLVFTSLASGNLDIWSLNLESGVRRQLTSAGGPEIAPAVSPDGSLIAFASTREAARRIWVMDSIGGNQRPLSAGPVDVLPFWSADGKTILFQRLGSNDTWGVTLSGVESQVTPIIARATSSDGRIAGYVGRTEGSRLGWSIAVAPPGGRGPATFLAAQRSTTNGPLTWSADGRAIDAVDPRDQNVWRYPVEGGQPTRLTNFTSGVIRAIAWSPDGQRLAISHGNDRADVVLFTDSGKP
jgi:Tol biopolymer transport system component/tRNA A-37 threonylcarbamoyl transferase component Bud32